jgi:hypothetical protein
MVNSPYEKGSYGSKVHMVNSKFKEAYLFFSLIARILSIVEDKTIMNYVK